MQAPRKRYVVRGSRDDALTSPARFESAAVERFVYIGDYFS